MMNTLMTILFSQPPAHTIFTTHQYNLLYLNTLLSSLSSSFKLYHTVICDPSVYFSLLL
jgi:hypothetical protein